jgi:hypothetical protein
MNPLLSFGGLCFLLFFVSSCEKKPSAEKEREVTIQVDSLNKKANREPLPLGPSAPFVNRYRGSIGQDKVELTLINWGNGTLDGYYQKNGAFGKIEFSGEIDLNEAFYLAEFSGLDQQGIFQGNFANARKLRGEWLNADSTVRQPFFLEQIPSVEEPAGWEGTWHLNGIYEGGTLIIGGVTEDEFELAISVLRNGNNGLCFGKAKYEADKARMETILFEGETEACILEFNHLSDFIEVKQASSTLACGFGARAFADGRYEKKLRDIKPQLSFGSKEAVFPTQNLHDQFYKMVGEDIYQVFAFNMQLVEEEEVQAKRGPLKMIRGGVSGMYTVHEAAILHDHKARIWAATLDFDDRDNPVIRYFTTEGKDRKKLPEALKAWTSRLPGYPVLYQETPGEYQ